MSKDHLPVRSRTVTEPLDFDAAIATARRLAELRQDEPTERPARIVFTWADEEG